MVCPALRLHEISKVLDSHRIVLLWNMSLFRRQSGLRILTDIGGACGNVLLAKINQSVNPLSGESLTFSPAPGNLVVALR